MKFSNPDVRSWTKKLERTNSPAGKNRSKSSTLSLHTVAASASAGQEDQEPQLQRRNSIHNVPFVDVNDPETRTRMERYKEERRSMLRAKYRAEDYLSSSFTRKKKLSSNSSQDSTESCEAVAAPAVSPPPDCATDSAAAAAPAQKPAPTPHNTLSQVHTSRKLVNLNPPGNIVLFSAAPEAEPVEDQCNLSVNVARTAEYDLPNINHSTFNTEDTVNVKERANKFGPCRIVESQVRTVTPDKSISSSKFSIKQTSPSKIKNMAALFEQKK